MKPFGDHLFKEQPEALAKKKKVKFTELKNKREIHNLSFLKAYVKEK